MRITDNILFNNFLFNINKINEKTYINNEKMASGKRLLNLDSDPISLSKVLSLKDINARFDQYVININSANSFLDAEDTALSNADDLLHKAGTLLVNGANTINNDVASRTAIAENLDAIKEELVDSANTVFQGKYLFSGSKTDTKPIQDVQNEATIISVNNKSTDLIREIKVEASESFGDINGLESGNYQIQIKDGKLYLYKNNTVVPIDKNSSDESDVGGNELNNYIDLSNPMVKEKLLNGDWINTGRGLKIKIDLTNPDVDVNNLDAIVTTYYKSGGLDIYMGDENERQIEYSDKLTSPINITAKQIFKPTNQTLENDNYLIDSTTQDAVTESSKLTDIDLQPELAEAIKKVATSTGYKLEDGDKIYIEGTDHNGNIVKGSFAVSASTTISDLLASITNMDSTEQLSTNKSFKTNTGETVVSATKLSSIADANIQNAIGSTLVIKGNKHDGTLVSTTINLTDDTTLSDIANTISSNFNVQVTIQHGKIYVEDKTPGSSSLKIQAYTQNSHVAIFGSFIETSHGGSGGFKDIDAYVKDGHIYFVDKRPSTSKFNLSFTIKDSSGNVKPNIFGVYNVKTLGQGVDAFKTLRDASYALKNPHSLNQIGKPTPWQDISTFDIKLSGRYLGDGDDTYTVSVANVNTNYTSQNNIKAISYDQIKAIADNLGDGQMANVGMLKVTNSKDQTVAVVGIKITKIDQNKYAYEIKTIRPDSDKNIDFSKITSIDQIEGTTIYDVKNTSPISSDDLAKKLVNGLNGVVIEADSNGNPGVKINLTPSVDYKTAILEEGDSFSFDVSNKVERALNYVKKSLDQVLSSRSITGARVNRFDLAKKRVDYIKLSNNKTISELEDANIADVFTEFRRNQIVMQATLAVGSKLTSQNLFDFIS